MVIKLSKRSLYLGVGVLALSTFIPVGLNVILKGNWSPAQIIVLSIAALLCAVSVWRYRRVAGDVEIRAANLVLSVCALVFTLILIEVLSRVYLWNFAPPSQFNQYASVNQLRKQYGQGYINEGGIAPHRYIGYIPAPDFEDGLNKHNSLGFRGDEIEQPKPEGVFRIACIGGSTTYSAVDSHQRAYPPLLEDHLLQAGYENIEVINAGMIGYTSWELLANLEFRVLDLEPDLLIIYHAINDVATRIVWPPEAYRGDNSGLRILRLQSIIMPPIWQYSTALRMAAITWGGGEPQSALNWQFDENPPTAHVYTFIEQKRLGTYPSGVFDEVSAETMLHENPPIYFERNLTSMIGIAQINNIDVLLLTFAILPVADPMVGSEEFQTGIAEGNEVVNNVAAATDVYYYDFAEDMPTGRRYFTSDGHHYTAQGNEVRAELIGDYLIDLGIVPD